MTHRCLLPNQSGTWGQRHIQRVLEESLMKGLLMEGRVKGNHEGRGNTHWVTTVSPLALLWKRSQEGAAVFPQRSSACWGGSKHWISPLPSSAAKPSWKQEATRAWPVLSYRLRLWSSAGPERLANKLATCLLQVVQSGLASHTGVSERCSADS